VGVKDDIVHDGGIVLRGLRGFDGGVHRADVWVGDRDESIVQHYTHQEEQGVGVLWEQSVHVWISDVLQGEVCGSVDIVWLFGGVIRSGSGEFGSGGDDGSKDHDDL